MKNIIFSLSMILFAFAFESCKHDNFDEFVGPSICPSSNFQMTAPFAVSSTNPDLNFGGLNMSATFNEAASWTIKLTGQTSGAVRTYKGKSTSVNVTWYGQPGSMVFFKNENVKIEFSIDCLDEHSTSQTISIVANNFNSFGVLGSDFDGNGTITNTTTLGYNATGWSSYGHSPGTGTTYNSFTVTNTPLSPPSGTNYLHVNATPAPTSWWSGGVYASISLSSLPTSDPDSIYFNAFVYGNSTTSLTISILGSGGPFNKTIDLGAWTGWRYISYPLSEVGVVNPLTLNGVEFGFGPSKNPGDNTEVNIDFMMFTAGEPFYEQ